MLAVGRDLDLCTRDSTVCHNNAISHYHTRLRNVICDSVLFPPWHLIVDNGAVEGGWSMTGIQVPSSPGAPSTHLTDGDGLLQEKRTAALASSRVIRTKFIFTSIQFIVICSQGMSYRH